MYDGGCSNCKTTFNLSINDSFKNLLNISEKAFKRLHEKGSYKPQDLKTETVYQDLITSTYDVFNFAIADNDMPNDMRTALQSDAFMFGGLKTHAQLLEASKLLLDENGNLKSFNQVSNDFNKLNNTYNKNYLESEYEFAVGSAQMAGKWSGFSDDETRYYLQYRTANDGKVRDEHKALHNITLPKSDPFWDSYYAPNGWRCRCNVVEVLADKYPTSNSKESIAKGEKATTKLDKNGKNTAELFRFNPGKDKKLFAPENTYTKLAGAKSAMPIIKNLEKNIKTTKTEYKNYSIDKLKEVYTNQNIDKEKESLIMNGGYVATSNAFDINEKLRKKIDLSDKDKNTVAALDDLIKANKLKDNVMLYRNVKNDFVKNTFGLDIEGLTISESIKKMKDVNLTKFSEKAFFSTSALKDVNAFKSRKVHLEVRANKETNALAVNNYSESEIILGRNQKFKIIDIVEDSDKIKLILETD